MPARGSPPRRSGRGGCGAERCRDWNVLHALPVIRERRGHTKEGPPPALAPAPGAPLAAAAGALCCQIKNAHGGLTECWRVSHIRAVPPPSSSELWNDFEGVHVMGCRWI
jgi:hypothetical protein